MCATVFYTKQIKGKLFPKAARNNGRYAYCQSVNRVDGKVICKYLGIRKLPRGKVARLEEGGTTKPRLGESNASKARRLRNRGIVLRAYGGFPPKCSCCGESNFKLLTIDHVNNDGLIHRNSITGMLYDWLIKKNFPSGFDVLCMNCNWGKYKNHGVCPHKDGQVPDIVHTAGS